MFESIRDAFRQLIQQNPDPETRRDALAQMRETLIRARMGLDDLRSGIEQTEKSVAEERAAIATMQRRRTLAERIQDEETVRLAARYEDQHGERLGVLERKLVVQRDELAMVEREVEEMSSDFRIASKGGVPGVGGGASENRAGFAEDVDGPSDPLDTAAFDAMQSRRRREDREARADEMLEALKRRMGR